MSRQNASKSACIAAWVRRYDPSRPLHYEGAIRFDWASDQTVSDIACPMYPSIDAIVSHARSGRQFDPVADAQLVEDGLLIDLLKRLLLGRDPKTGNHRVLSQKIGQRHEGVFACRAFLAGGPCTKRATRGDASPGSWTS